MQRLILASGAQPSIRFISFRDLEDQDVVADIVGDSATSVLVHLPCLRDLGIEANEERHINYNSILTALQCPAQAEEEDHPSLCPQLRHLDLGFLLLDSSLLHKVVLGRSANPAVHKLVSVTGNRLQFTDDVPPAGDHLE